MKSLNLIFTITLLTQTGVAFGNSTKQDIVTVRNSNYIRLKSGLAVALIPSKFELNIELNKPANAICDNFEEQFSKLKFDNCPDGSDESDPLCRILRTKIDTLRYQGDDEFSPNDDVHSIWRVTIAPKYSSASDNLKPAETESIRDWEFQMAKVASIIPISQAPISWETKTTQHSILRKISRVPGIQSSPIRVSADGRLYVRGLDLYCDILNKRISLKANHDFTVVLDSVQSREMQKKLMDTSRVLAQPVNSNDVSNKLIVMGYRLGGLISRFITPLNASTNEQLVRYLAKLFIDTNSGEAKPNWNEAYIEKSIWPSKAEVVDVEINATYN